MTTSRRLKRRVGTTAALATVGLGLLGAAWLFSDALVRARPVRRVVKPVRILALDGDLVTLPANATTRRPGVLGLDLPGGHALLGAVQDGTRRTVTRKIIRADSDLSVGLVVLPTSIVYKGTPAIHHLDHQDVRIATPLGDMPAWLIPAASDIWIIVVHGYQGMREDALRILPTFQRLDITSLTVTYRNAHDAPRTETGYYQLGAAEWQDVEAAAEYAVQHGAKQLFLFGFSMGGNIVLSFLRRSPLAHLVRGVLLDSPALDWRDIIRSHAARFRAPWAAGVVERATVLRSGQDFNEVDQLRAAQEFHTPMLILHGDADLTVPYTQSEALAAARPDLVTFIRVPGGHHVRAWNIDPEGYEVAVEGFVRERLETS